MKIQTIQLKEELDKLIKIYRELKPKTVLEIGSASGGTLLHFIMNAPLADTFIAIDLKVKQLYKLKDYLRQGQTLNLIEGSSRDIRAARQVVHFLGGQPLDFLFIDGDHSRLGVTSDFIMYSPLVENGIIALHDIVTHHEKHDCHVSELWGDIVKLYDTYEIIDARDQGWGGIGLVMKGSFVKACEGLLDQRA